jgi:hypothetical protein
VIRRVMVTLLAVGMGMLSFDALRAYALTGRPLTDGVIPRETILPRPWLAMLWAVVIDLTVAAGIWGVKDDRRDWRAWLMLLLALGATLGFQVFALSPFVARAVPPVGLALAILVLDLGPARPKPATAARPPAPARLRAWLGSWELPAESVAEPSAQPTAEPPAELLPNGGSAKVRPLRPAERRKVDRLAAEGLSANAISQRTRIPYKPVRQHLRPQETTASPNGDRP